MQNIRMRLTPANKASQLSFRELEEDSIRACGVSIFQAAANYANGSDNFKRGKKKMDVEEVRDGCLIVTLSSAAPLQQASRSFSGFSRELLRLAQAQGLDLTPLIYNHTVFHYAQVPADPAAAHDPAAGMTDVEAAKRFIDLFFGRQLTLTKEDAAATEARKEQIKALLVQQ